MEALKIVFTCLYVVICLALILLAMVQTKEEGGASSTIVGSSSNSFYEQNKGRTREGKLKRWTIILGVIFALFTVAIGILYIM